MDYTIKPIVCDYAVIRIGTSEAVCICNIKRNAELIADILNGDADNSCAYSYDVYPNAKYKIVKAESENEKALEQKYKVEDSNFSTKQYEVDLRGAYDCGYNSGYVDAMSDMAESENEE